MFDMNEKTVNVLSTLIVAGIILVVLLLISIFIPNRYEISIRTSGILGRLGDENYFEVRDIYIDGVYTRSLFKRDVFHGRFIVEGIDFTAEDGSAVVLHDDSEFGATMLYINLEKLRITSQKDTNSLGVIFFSPKFEYFSILIHEPTGEQSRQTRTNEGRLFLSAPAENRSEALQIMREMLAGSVYDSIILHVIVDR